MKLIYVNPTTQQFVDVDGKVENKILTVYFGVKTQYSFQFLNDDNSIINIEDGEYYLAANNNLDDFNSCCFLCKDYSVKNNTITFNVDTFNKTFQNKIRKKDTELFLELGFKKLNTTSYIPLLSSTILAQPRVFVNGNEPPPIKLYYTKDEIDALLSKHLDVSNVSDVSDINPILDLNVDIYSFSNALESLTIESVATSFNEIELYFTTGNSFTASFPANLNWLKEIQFETNSKYVVSIKNNIAVGAKCLEN